MGGFNFIFCVAENFIKTVGFDFIVSNANDSIKNSESSTLSTKKHKNIFSVPHRQKRQISFGICRFYFCEFMRHPPSVIIEAQAKDRREHICFLRSF